MKIAQVTNVFPPYKAGMGQVPFYYAQELYKLSQDVEVITPDYGLGRGEYEFKVKYIKPWFKWGLAAFCPQVFFNLNKYEVVQLHFPSFGMAEAVWLWRIFFGQRKKFFVFYHMDNVASGWLGLIFKIYTKLITPLILKSADKVLVSSFDYIEYSNLKKFFKKNRDKFVELPFGVTDKYKPGKRNLELLKQFDIDIDKKIILFVGGLRREHYFKGVDYLLKALSRLEYKNWHFVAVGKGELIKVYEKQARDLKIDKKVSFLGFQPDEVMPDWYNLAYVTVLPSIDRSEAFGIVLIEAQGCGSPVIASDLLGVRTAFEDGKTGFAVKPKDVDDLQNKLQQILSNDELHQEMAKNAAQRVQDKYLWSQIGKRLLEIYKN